jgi:sarcosine oxidase subunit gamma
MPERYQWQSALATLGVEARARVLATKPGVVLSEQPAFTQLAIRGDASESKFSDTVAQTLGLELPVTPKTANRKSGTTLLWLGPDEWLAVIAPKKDTGLIDRLAGALGGVYHAIVDVSHSRAVIGLEGAHAREVLMKGTNVDLHPRAFATDNCIQAHLARCHMLLHQLDDGPRYHVYIHRSFAVYAWNWLSDAAREYGLAVRGAGTEKM